MNGHYSLPAGKVEKNETFLEAAVREAKEEVGVNMAPEDLRLVMTSHRVHKDSAWVDIMFQAMKWKGELYNAEPHVHGELAWFDPVQLPGNIVPPVREAIEAIESGETYLEKTYGT
jgi:ADP-ribose pyrophosphatase YjhB (NUDIX family)